MAFDLIPKSFWSFPSIRPSLEDEDWFSNFPTTTSGLSVSEDDKNIYIEANMPGLKIEDIEVTLHKGELWLRGSRKEEEKDKKRKYYRMSSSDYSYRVLVPGEVDEQTEPHVIYKDGVLSATFAKIPQKTPKKISIRKS